MKRLGGRTYKATVRQDRGGIAQQRVEAQLAPEPQRNSFRSLLQLSPVIIQQHNMKH